MPTLIKDELIAWNLDRAFQHTKEEIFSEKDFIIKLLRSRKDAGLHRIHDDGRIMIDSADCRKWIALAVLTDEFNLIEELFNEINDARASRSILSSAVNSMTRIGRDNLKQFIDDRYIDFQLKWGVEKKDLYVLIDGIDTISDLYNKIYLKYDYKTLRGESFTYSFDNYLCNLPYEVMTYVRLTQDCVKLLKQLQMPFRLSIVEDSIIDSPQTLLDLPPDFNYFQLSLKSELISRFNLHECNLYLLKMTKGDGRLTHTEKLNFMCRAQDLLFKCSLSRADLQTLIKRWFRILRQYMSDSSLYEILCISFNLKEMLEFLSYEMKGEMV